MKSNRIFTFILSGAMLLPLAGLAQTANSAAPGSDATNNASQEHRGERGERFAKELNLTPEQKSEIKAIRENTRQQAQAIKNDSSMTPDQKKAKFHELHQSAQEQIMSKLNPDQQTKFKQMQEERREHRGRGKRDHDSGAEKGNG